MSDVTAIQRRISQLDVSPQFDSYSKVIIHIDDDTAYEWGTNTGRTLEFDNPFGSLQMCKDILARLQGYQYQPYTADGALLDPAAEIGDALSSPLVYGGIYTRSKTFGRLMKSDVSAPTDEEINHEYKFETPEQREFTRATSELRASLSVTNASITAEVTARQAADTTLTGRINQEVTDRQTAVTNLSSQLTITASQIKSTVAASQKQYDTTGYTVSYYGYGTPAQAGVAASGNNGKYYLDQASGKLYKSNGSTWTQQTTLTLLSSKLQSQITQQASQIAAKVSQTGGNNSSFGWTLTSSGFSLYSGNKEVMKCDKNGLTVKGNIAGSTGTIGGFTIGSSALYTNNMSSMSSTQSTGVHLSASGIKLGQNFRVDSGGNLTCANATITGSLNVGGQYITAAQLGQGAYAAYNGAGNWNSAYTSTSSGGYCYGAASSWNNAKTTSSSCDYFQANTIVGGTVAGRNGGTLGGSAGNQVVIKGSVVNWRSAYVVTSVWGEYNLSNNFVDRIRYSGQYIYYLGS